MVRQSNLPIELDFYEENLIRNAKVFGEYKSRYLFNYKELESDYMLREPEKRIEAGNILVQSNKSDDLKLFEVFQIYKEDLQKECSQLYYALLAWKDSHLKELLTEQSKQK